MSNTAQINRKLNQWLENDRQIVTFRQVSREFGCHVNTAKNILLTHARSNPAVHLTYLLSGPLLSTSSLALTQLPSDPPKLDAKSLAQLAASQRIKIVDMDQVSDGERNSEDGSAGGDPDDMLTNDKGDEDGIAGHTDLPIRIEEEELITPESTPRWGVVMAAQEYLEEKRALFEPDGLNVHIYALSPGPINDPAQYLIPNTQLREYPNYNDPKYGGISGDLAQGIGGSGGKALKEGTMSFGTKARTKKEEAGKTKKEEVGKKGWEVKEEGKEEKVPEGVRGKGQQDKKAEAAKKDVKIQSETQPEPASSSSSTRKPSSSAPKSKKRIITSDDEQDLPPTDTAEPIYSPGRQQTSSMVRADDRAAMEAMMGMDFDMDDNEDEQVVKEEEKPKVGKKSGRAGAKKTEANDDKKGTSVGRSGRKRRKVKKSKMEMDDKGYMVTKDYTSEESYSGESDPEPQPKSSKSKPSRPLPRKSTQSRASSVSTETADPAPASGQGGGGSTSSVGSAKPVPGGRAVPPPKNVPGKLGKPRGQSTLAGFFTKKQSAAS